MRWIWLDLLCDLIAQWVQQSPLTSDFVSLVWPCGSYEICSHLTIPSKNTWNLRILGLKVIRSLPWEKRRYQTYVSCDLTIKVWMWKKIQKFSREWLVKQKTGSGKASITLSTETQLLLTSGNSTHRQRAVLQTPPSSSPPPQTS